MNLKTGTNTVLAALMAMSGTALAGDYSTWAKVRPVTLNTSSLGLGAGVSNIPLLVRFNATDHADMFTGANMILANGADVRVTKADGTTDVPFEIESATTGVNGRMSIWIKADAVAANSASAASFRVYWGKTGATTLSSSTAVFDTTNGYLAVWHMNGNANDATAYGHNGTAGTYGTGAVPTDTVGISGGAKRFTGDAANTGTNGGYYSVVQGTGPTSLNLNTNNGQYTLSAWVRPDNCANSARMSLVSKYANDGSNKTKAWALQTSGGSGNWRHVNNPINLYNTPVPSPKANEFFSESPCTVAEWQYVSGSYKSNGVTAGDTLNADMAARLAVTTNAAGTTAPGTASQGITTIGDSADVLIGRLHGASTAGGNLRFLRGALDEVRISRVARDSNWVKLEYATQRPTGVTALTVGASQAANNPYAAWTGTREIKLNTTAAGAKVNAAVRNFPVLIRLGANETAILGAANGGNSIRFSKADGSTALPYQIDTWTSTSAAIWVKLDTIKGNDSAQKIIMYYGNSAAASESNPAAVFDTAQYLAVWHLGEATGAQTDYTGRGNTANVNGTSPVAQANGLIGAAKTFDGTSMSYQIGTNATALDLNTNVGPYTLSAWAKPVSCDARIAAISKYSNSNDIAGRQYALHTANTATTWRFTNGAPALNGAGDAEFTADAPDACVPGSWSYVVGTYRQGGTPTADSAVNTKIYVNGALAASGSTAAITGTSLGNLSNTYIGRIATDERYMNGDLDEIRVSKVARDSNWIRLSYENQKFANTLTNIGLPVLSAPGAPTNVSGLPGARNSFSITVSWTAPANNGNSPITGYRAQGTGADSTKFCTSTTTSCTVTGLTGGQSYSFVVKATNAIGTSAASTASTPVTAPTNIAGPGSLLISVGHFARPYTFVLPAAAMAVTDELTMTISDVWGRQVWSKTITPAESKVGELTWNGMSANGHKAGTGIYIVRIKAVGEGKAKEAAQMGVKLRN